MRASVSTPSQFPSCARPHFNPGGRLCWGRLHAISLSIMSNEGHVHSNRLTFKTHGDLPLVSQTIREHSRHIDMSGGLEFAKLVTVPGSTTMHVYARRPRRALASFVLLCVASTWLIALHHSSSRDHYLSPSLIRQLLPLESSPATDSHASFGKATQTACRAHGFTARDELEQPVKIYDLVLLSTELDWLEIRLHTLADYVDYFVILVSSTTSTGNAKPLYLKDHWDSVKDFHHKIIYRVVEDMVHSQRIWDHEDFFRDALFSSVFPTLENTVAQARFGDVLVVSDMDEILRPETLLLLRYCHIPARLTFRTHFYYYSFQWLHQGPQWSHPDATVFRGPATVKPNDLRQGLLEGRWTISAAIRRWWDRGTLWNAGWHCSSCFDTVSETITKMNSFSHQGWNTAENRNRSTLVSRVQAGKDLFGRADQSYSRVEANADIPSYILQQHQLNSRFGYLLDRDGVSAGFEDYLAPATIPLLD